MTAAPTYGTNLIACNVLSATVISVNRFLIQDTTANAPNNTVAHATEGADIFGVSKQASASGSTAPISVQLPGDIVTVEAGEAIANGANISSDANGVAKVSESGNAIVGKALNDAVSGGLVSVQLVGASKNAA